MTLSRAWRRRALASCCRTTTDGSAMSGQASGAAKERSEQHADAEGDQQRGGRLLVDEARDLGSGRAGRLLGGCRGPLDMLARLHLGFLGGFADQPRHRSEEHTSDIQSLMRISYTVF